MNKKICIIFSALLMAAMMLSGCKESQNTGDIAGTSTSSVSAVSVSTSVSDNEGANENDSSVSVHEHTFVNATLESPKTCTLCGLTEGEPVKVTEADLSCLEYGDWTYVMTDATAIVVLDRGAWCVYVYDYSGNQISGIRLYEDWSEDLFFYDSWGLSVNSRVIAVTKYFQTPRSSGDGGYEIMAFVDIYNKNGETLYHSQNIVSNYADMDESEKVGIKLEGNNVMSISYPLAGAKEYYDIDAYEPLTAEAAETKINTVADKHAKAGWYYYAYNESADVYLVSPEDKSYWGYHDKDGNEIARYADASDFNPAGFSLVSHDRKTYDLIDKDFNVVVKGFAEGISASCSSVSGWFLVTTEDGSKRYFYIE